MEYCPYCMKYVNVIIHNYYNEYETYSEKRCEICGKTIIVDHYPVRTLTDTLSDPNYTGDEKLFKELMTASNQKMMRGMFPEEDENGM